MRTVLGLALCFFLGACATFGGGGPDPYGLWDIVSVNGEALPAAELAEGWCDLRADGTESCTLTVEGLPEPMTDTSPFTLGELEDGCFPYESTDAEGVTWVGSICGDVFTVTGGDINVVLHKRR